MPVKQDSRLGWQGFFVLTIVYFMAACFSTIQHLINQPGIVLESPLSWLLFLLLSVLYMIAAYGYANRRYLFSYRFWLAVLACSLLSLIYDTWMLLSNDARQEDYPPLVFIGGTVFFIFLYRLLYSYAKEVNAQKT